MKSLLNWVAIKNVKLIEGCAQPHGADCLPIKSGKLLGLKTCAVLTGYALLNDVENCSPDLIIKDITDFDISNLL